MYDKDKKKQKGENNAIQLSVSSLQQLGVVLFFNFYFALRSLCIFFSLWFFHNMLNIYNYYLVLLCFVLRACQLEEEKNVIERLWEVHPRMFERQVKTMDALLAKWLFYYYYGAVSFVCVQPFRCQYYFAIVMYIRRTIMIGFLTRSYVKCAVRTLVMMMNQHEWVSKRSFTWWVFKLLLWEMTARVHVLPTRPIYWK